MSTALLLPRLGETMEQGRVVAWLRQPGESFVRGETIVEIETDKTVVELPALVDGVLRTIAAPEGTDVDVGAPLGYFDAIGAEGEVAPSVETNVDAEPAQEKRTGATQVDPGATGVDETSRNRASGTYTVSGERLRATPNARRVARHAGVDLTQVRGSGRRARIQGTDVLAVIGTAGSRGVAQPTGSASVAGPVAFRTVAAGRMAYREWGSANVTAAPLVALHGYSGDSQVWSVLASHLQRGGRRIIAPDLPSHGATDFDRADLDGLTDAVIAFLDDLQLPQVELVGHSLGAAVAVKVAAALGSRVKRLTLIAPAGLGSEIDADFIDGMASVVQGGGLAHLLQRTAMYPPQLSPPQLDQMASAIHARGALLELANNFVYRGRQQIDISADLAAMQDRVRVIWGLDDKIIPWHHAARAGFAIPVFFIPQCGHMPQWDHPQQVAALFG
jgi:pimeloyl-ACP methyl ester carboxylesterase